MLKISAVDIAAIRAASGELDQAFALAKAEAGRDMQPAVEGFRPVKAASAAKAAKAARIATLEQIRSHARSASDELDRAGDSPAIVLARRGVESLTSDVDFAIGRVKRPVPADWWTFGSIAGNVERAAGTVRTLADAIEAPTVEASLAHIASDSTRTTSAATIGAAVASAREDGLGLLGRTLARGFRGPTSVKAGSEEALRLDAATARSAAFGQAVQVATEHGEQAAIARAFSGVLRSVIREPHALADVNRSALVTASVGDDLDAITARELREYFEVVARRNGNEGRSLPAWFDTLDPDRSIQLGRVEAEELLLLATARDAEQVGDHLASRLAQIDRTVNYGTPSPDPLAIVPAIASQRLPESLRPTLRPWMQEEYTFRLGEPIVTPSTGLNATPTSAPIASTHAAPAEPSPAPGPTLGQLIIDELLRQPPAKPASVADTIAVP